ncbi:MAG: riboflavin biosynthesis protein RibF [Deltaproteobacteria bacterium]|nr:MAG: riboflavin biosynthesis protein RibF [Deltaproteobacteria bacterium]
MRVLEDKFSPDDFKHPVVTIGSFDGVHLGHQALIRRAIEEARRVKGEAVVLTFNPHPMKVLFPQKRLMLITPHEKKLGLFEDMGVDVVIGHPFTRQLSEKPPEAFVEEILYRGIRPLKVVVGYNFTFGKGRSGTAETLRDLGNAFGFEVEVLDPFRVDSKPVSSSRIRELILQGDLQGASRLMGRRFFFSGRVIRGNRRGKELGVPTANLQVDPDQILPQGVFAVWVRVGDSPYPGVLNIGRRPTFGPGKLSVEVHLIGFSGDLYGRDLLVEVVEKIRDERPFEGPVALLQQIRADIDKASEILRRGSR